MARIRQPDEVAKFKGSHKRNPQRYRKEVPKSELPLGNYPDHITDGAKKCWFELEAYVKPGVLTSSDRWIMEITSETMAEFREAPRKFSASNKNCLVSMMARLGLTPADRVKLGVDKEKKENRFARWV